MAADVSVHRLHNLPSDRLADLVVESEKAGYHFLRRLVEDRETGSNRFSRTGEALFAAIGAGRIVGVCGLNSDPYHIGGQVGRVCHLYVAVEFRRCGIGRLLVATVVTTARLAFERLRLRTDDESAARFYEVLGFRRCDGELDWTHTLELGV